MSQYLRIIHKFNNFSCLISGIMVKISNKYNYMQPINKYFVINLLINFIKGGLNMPKVYSIKTRALSVSAMAKATM